MIRVKGTTYEPMFPLWVAEVGQNHNGDVDTALQYLEMVRYHGWAYKTQLHIPHEEMIRNRMPSKVYRRIAEHALTFEQEMRIREAAFDENVPYVATPFSLAAVEWLKLLEPDAVKIGSGELFNNILVWETVEVAINLNKPLFMSMGMVPREKLQEAVTAVDAIGALPMFCESVYPSRWEHFPLTSVFKRIRDGYSDFGYSCHSLGSLNAWTAYVLGAQVLEFHVAITPDAHDAKVSWPHTELKKFQSLVMSHSSYKHYDNDVMQWATHCLVAACDIKKGESLMGKLKTMRPSTAGVAVDQIESFESLRARRAIMSGEILQWEDIDGSDAPDVGAAGGTAGEKGQGPAGDLDPASKTKTVH